MTDDPAASGNTRDTAPSVPLVSYHTHTDLSHCGRADMTFEAAIEVAVSEGYSALGFTDHIHPVGVTDHPWHAARLRQYREMRKRLSPPLRVFIGGEFDVVTPGTMVECDEILAECEYCLVAPNHYHVHWIQSPGGDAASVASHELDALETALDWPHTNAIAHPFAGNVGRPDCGPNEQYRACDRYRLRELLIRAVERGIALEIQPKFWYRPELAGELGELFDSWIDLGGLIALGSDAHTLESLRQWARCYREIVRRFRLTPEGLWHPDLAKDEDRSLRRASDRRQGTSTTG